MPTAGLSQSLWPPAAALDKELLILPLRHPAARNPAARPERQPACPVSCSMRSFRDPPGHPGRHVGLVQGNRASPLSARQAPVQGSERRVTFDRAGHAVATAAALAKLE